MTPINMPLRMREYPNDNLPQQRTEPLRRIEVVLREPISSGPVPIVHLLRRSEWLIDLNPDDQGDIGLACGTVEDGAE
jgi:hypothetical protein